MNKKLVLIVDDSALVRKMVIMAMDGDPDLEGIIAPNAQLGLSKIERSHPDLVVLDVEMPDMNGLDVLEKIHQQFPKLPVIMFSTQTELGSSLAMEALSRGATDCVAKPHQLGGVEESLEYVREHLLTKVRGLCHLPIKPAGGWAPVKNVSAAVPNTPQRWSPVGPSSPSDGAAKTSAALSVKEMQKEGHAGSKSDSYLPRVSSTTAISKVIPLRQPGIVELLVIGVSTGGPNALASVIPSLSKDIPVPVLIVQHMPPMFTKLLAERMSHICPLRCKEAEDGEEVTAGDLRIAPGNFHMTVARKETRFVLRLNQDPPENSCRPAVDVLFRHAAACAQNRVLAVVLTGMGQDGLRGAESIRAEGGLIVAQDEATSVVWGMPGAVANAGLADAILPLQEIGPDIMRRLRGGKR
jgi:two-component system, chemotaxis family, protein-glutamate methylesterase/glutaminase